MAESNIKFVIEHGLKIDVNVKYLVFNKYGELVRTGNDELLNSSDYKYPLPQKWFSNDNDETFSIISNGLRDVNQIFNVDENDEFMIEINNVLPGKLSFSLSKINSIGTYTRIDILYCALVNSNINNFRLNPDMPNELVFDRTDTSWGLFFTGIKKLGYSDNVLDYIIYDSKNNELPLKHNFHSYIDKYGRGVVEYYGEAVYLVYDTINNLTFEKNKTDIIKCFYGNFEDYHPDSTTNVNGVYKYMPKEYEVSLKVTIVEPEGYTGKIPLRGIKTLSPRFSLDDFTNNKVTTNKFIKFIPSDASIEIYLTSGDFYSDNNDLILIKRLKNYKAESQNDFFNNFFKFSNDNKNLGSARIGFKWRNNPMGIGGTEYQTVYVHVGASGDYNDSSYSSDNEQETSNIRFAQTKFNYDLSDGDLIIYKNGNYRFSRSNEIVGVMITGVTENANYRLYFNNNSKSYEFTYKDKNNDEYTIIPTNEINLLGDSYLSIDRYNGKAYGIRTIIYTYDSKFNISFKVKECIIDRSNPKSYTMQLPYANNLFNYISINNMDSNINYNKSNVHFYINTYSPGSAIYEGNAISIQNDYLWNCTFEDNTETTIKVSYGSIEYDSMTIKIITSDPDKIYVRGMNISKTRFELNKKYTLKDCVTFIPHDCLFKYLYLDNFIFTGSSLYMKINVHKRPTSWDEFFNNYIDIDFIKTGNTHLQYVWKCLETGGGGGDEIIYILNSDSGSESGNSGSSPIITEDENNTNILEVKDNSKYVYYNDNNIDNEIERDKRNLSTITVYISKKSNY